MYGCGCGGVVYVIQWAGICCQFNKMLYNAFGNIFSTLVGIIGRLYCLILWGCFSFGVSSTLRLSPSSASSLSLCVHIVRVTSSRVA